MSRKWFSIIALIAAADVAFQPFQLRTTISTGFDSDRAVRATFGASDPS